MVVELSNLPNCSFHVASDIFNYGDWSGEKFNKLAFRNNL